MSLKNFLNGVNSNKRQLISGFLIAGVVLSLFGMPQIFGAAVDDLNAQRQQKASELAVIQKKIADYQKDIKLTQSAQNTLKNQITIINLEIATTMAQIDATNNQIETTNIEIADVTEKIVTTEKQIASQKEVLKSLIAEIYDLDQRSPLEIALENDNFDEFLDQVQYTTSIQERSQETLTRIKELRSELDLRQADLKKEKAQLSQLMDQLTVTKANLSGQQAAKQTLLADTKGQERAYQKLLTDSQVQQKALDDEINNLDSQIAAKLGNKKLRANHGMLAYPMEGVMTQGYGNTGFTALGYSFHNGIDIAAPAGTPIYSAADGTVISTGTGKAAYGNWVAIKHSSGVFASHPIVTLYCHMSSFRVSTGQVMRLGDLVGFEGNTGNTTALLYGPGRGYHIHFGVYDAEGFGVADGAYAKTYGPYRVPYGAVYNPLDFL